MIRIEIGTVNIDTVSQAGSVNFGNTLHVLESPFERVRSPEGEERKRGRAKIRNPCRRGGCPEFPPPLPYPPGLWFPSVPMVGWMGVPFFYW